MRWGPFWLTLLLVVVLQTSVIYALDWRWMHLLLALALLCGLNAPTHDARIAGWIAGFVQDLLTESSTLGLHALAYGSAILLLTYMRDRLNPSVWWIRWLLAGITAWAALLVVDVGMRWWLLNPPSGPSIWSGGLRDALIAALLAVACTELPWFLPRGRRFRSVR